jgi:hypothetical protein
MKKIPWTILSVLSLGFLIFGVSHSEAGETPTMVIEEAKFVIEEARKAGGDRIAADDCHAAKLWLAQAEKEYAEALEQEKAMIAETNHIAHGTVKAGGGIVITFVAMNLFTRQNGESWPRIWAPFNLWPPMPPRPAGP